MGAGEPLPQTVPLALSYRGAVVEAVHCGQVAAAWSSGSLATALGDPEVPVVLRSAAKPLQALAVVTSGAADRFRLEPRHLAVVCASHQGSVLHLAAVWEILDRLGLGESDLQCGAHWPDDREEHERLIRAGLSPSALHNNCSGKHAGMLATALALQAPIHSYLEPNHPVQGLIRRHLALLSGMAEEALVALVDGCSAPTYALPLSRIACAFARLVRPEGLPGELREAARRVTAAMSAHPEMVQGPGSFNTDLLRESAGAVIAKGGAEGLFALGLPEKGLGLAVKIADGSGRAWPPVVLALLGGILPLPPALVRWVRPEQTNCRGTVVGHLEATAAVWDSLPGHPGPQEGCL